MAQVNLKINSPVTEIADAANITANSNETIRSFFTAIPTEIAVSSPIVKYPTDDDASSQKEPDD